MANKKITKLNDEQYFKYISSLKDGAAAGGEGTAAQSSEQVPLAKGASDKDNN